MKHKPLSQEWLKLIACATMLLDHVGAVFFPQTLWLRVIGRMAFPIYCFLLCEGTHHTKNPVRYGLRLFIGLLLAEIPFDLALYGQVSFAHQNVMVTLLLGFLALLVMKKVPLWTMPLVALPFAMAAEWLHTDYGAMGIMTVALFALTRDLEEKRMLQSVGLVGLSFLFFPGNVLQPLAVLSMIPISLYSGRKATGSKLLQWGFYLFYPLHLLVLWLISAVL